jgi:hypothetical protein
MSRKYVDCRELPNDINCSVALSADSEGELWKRPSSMQSRNMAIKTSRNCETWSAVQ